MEKRNKERYDSPQVEILELIGDVVVSGSTTWIDGDSDQGEWDLQS